MRNITKSTIANATMVAAIYFATTLSIQWLSLLVVTFIWILFAMNWAAALLPTSQVQMEIDSLSDIGQLRLGLAFHLTFDIAVTVLLLQAGWYATWCAYVGSSLALAFRHWRRTGMGLNMFKRLLHSRPVVPKEHEAFVQTTKVLLGTQFMLANTSGKDAARDFWCLGYIYGTHDALLQMHGVQGQQAVQLIETSYGVLFDDKEFGEGAACVCVGMVDNPEFLDGQKAGGSDVIKWMQTKIPQVSLLNRLTTMQGAPAPGQ